MNNNRIRTEELIITNETIARAYAKGGSFARDFDAVKEEHDAQRAGLPVDYLKLASLIRVSGHKDGKIEGLLSIDSSATGCSFCEAMRKYAAMHPGTCICEHCYDYAQEHDYRAINILPRHWLNMVILASFDFPMEALATLKIAAGVELRFNSSGDVENNTHALNLAKIALLFPNNPVGFWSKNQAAVEYAFDTLGKPANVRYVQSSPLIGVPAKKSRYADTTFTVYYKKDIAAALAAGANECNGRKCKAECGCRCYHCAGNGGFPDGSDTAEALREKKGRK